jgi:hypothetical protein
MCGFDIQWCLRQQLIQHLDSTLKLTWWQSVSPHTILSPLVCTFHMGAGT